MNQDTVTETYTSSQSSSHKNSASKVLTKQIDVLLNARCTQLREKVESTKDLNILTFYSRVIFTAVEAINAIIDKLNTQNLFPAVEDTDALSFEPLAYELFCKKACDITKDVRIMFSNTIMGSSPANRTGDSKKVLMWKKQCNKNMEKIEMAIRNTFLKDYCSWYGTFSSYGTFIGVSGVVASLASVLMLKESADDERFKVIAESIFENFETTYREKIRVRVDEIVKQVKDTIKREEESDLKDSQKEEDALEKLQQDDTVKRFQEEDTGKEPREAESQKKQLQEEETQEIIQEKETQKEFLEDETSNKVEADETSVTDDEIMESMIGDITFKIKNSVLDRVVE